MLARRNLVPRALAVLSCALALLAAQPASAAGAGKGPAAVAVAAPSQSTSPVAATERRAGAQRSAARPSEGPALFASARRLHILATVEIFQRLLMAELRVDARVTQASFLAIFEPACVAVVDVPRVAGLRAAPRTHFTPPLAAQQFAIEHCLLAPPLA
jgi:hypothetical protein